MKRDFIVDYKEGKRLIDRDGKKGIWQVKTHKNRQIRYKFPAFDVALLQIGQLVAIMMVQLQYIILCGRPN